MLDEIKAVLTATIEPYRQKMEQVKNINNNVNKSVENVQKKVNDTFSKGTQSLQMLNKKVLDVSNSQQSLMRKYNGIDLKLFDSFDMAREVIEIDNNVSKLNVNTQALVGNFKLTKEQINNSKNSVQELKEQVTQINNKMDRFNNNSSKGFEKGLKSLKKFSLGLIGVRSTLSLFNNYMGNYLSLNEQASAQNEITTNTITMSLAPALQILLDTTQYVAIGFALLIEMLTGTNILSNITTKNLRDAASAASSLGDNLTGLDEIENLNGEGKGTGLASSLKHDLKALDEFNKKVENVRRLFEKFGVDKIMSKVKDVFEWIIDHPMETALGIGAFMTLKGLLPSILGVSGGTTGLFGLSSILAALMKIGVITIGIKIIYDNINKINDAVDDLEKYTSKVTNQYTSQFDKWLELAQDSYQKYLETGNETYKKISDDAYQSAIDLANDQADYLKNNSGRLSWWNFIFNHDDYVAAEKELELVKEQAKNAQKDLENINGIKSTATIDLDMDTSKAENKINNLWDVIKYAGNNIWDSVSGTVSGLFNAFKADGGIFVNGTWHDVTAYKGGGSPVEGQYFVAREQGPELVGTIGNHTAVMNNNQIVSSVSDGVAMAVAKVMGATQQRSSNTNAVFNIDGREFARAIYPYLQEEAQRMGSSLSIRRA